LIERLLALADSKEKDLEYFYTISLQRHIGKNLNVKSVEKFKNEFREERTIFLSIINDEKIIGYIILINEIDAVQLKRIVIDENYLGIGQEVLRLLEKYCLKTFNTSRLWLDVYADNLRAINAYKKVGYTQFKKGRENNREVVFYKLDLMKDK